MGDQYSNRRAITLSETVIATMLISFVLVSTLQIVGPMVRSTSVHTDRLLASNLANEMLGEISTKLFVDPDSVNVDSLGVESNELAVQRRYFDDIDDFDGIENTPPQLSNGASYTNLQGWTRSVIVQHVEVANPSSSSLTETGLKRVRVVVQKDGVTLASVNALHSEAADILGFIVPAQGSTNKSVATK